MKDKDHKEALEMIKRYMWAKDGTVHVDLFYPRSPGNPEYLEVGLLAVRAADNIRISYDFDRDGWVIEQASVFEWEPDDEEMDPDWQEVAFVQAWDRDGE